MTSEIIITIIEQEKPVENTVEYFFDSGKVPVCRRKNEVDSTSWRLVREKIELDSAPSPVEHSVELINFIYRRVKGEITRLIRNCG